MAREPKILYQGGSVKIRTLRDDEIAEFRKLRTGIYQTATAIRSVAVCDGYLHVLELTAGGYNRIRMKIESKGHLHYAMHRDTRKARAYARTL